MYKVSIITINYNNCEGLRKTMESVFMQSVHDYEYIIVDGDSTDGSKEIITNLHGDNIKTISEKDSGLFNAMNKGTRIAKGEYVLFLNSGDLLHDVNVIADFNINHGTADIISGHTICEKDEKFSHIWLAPEEITLDTFYSGSLCHQSTFIRRQLLIKNPYIETNSYCSDRIHFLQELCFGKATYQIIHRNVSRFDCSGISSSAANEEKKQKEVRENLKNTIPPIILRDYDRYIGQRCELEEWIINNRKSVIVRGISLLINVCNKIRRNITIIMNKQLECIQVLGKQDKVLSFPILFSLRCFIEK